MSATSMTWREDAACADYPYPDPIFFPNHLTGRRPSDRRGRDVYRTAREICADCPVRAQCLEDDMAQPEPQHGMWAGLTRTERWALRRRRERQVELDRQRRLGGAA